MNDDELVLVPPSGLVPAILLALLLVAAAAVKWPFALAGEGRPDLTLDSWREPAAELWQQSERALEARPERPEEAEIRDGLVAWLALEATRGVAVADDADARRLRGRVEEQVRGLGLRGGNDAVVAMAQRYGRAVALAAQDALAAGRDAGAPVHDLPATVPARAALDRIAPGVSSLLDRAALGRELLPDGRLPPEALGVLASLAARRALEMGTRLPAPRPEPGSKASRAWLAFRVERGMGVPMPRRLDLLDELAELDPSYPRSFATGVILTEARKFRAARAAFLAAATVGERPDAARANARYCRRRMADSAEPGDG